VSVTVSATGDFKATFFQNLETVVARSRSAAGSTESVEANLLPVNVLSRTINDNNVIKSKKLSHQGEYNMYYYLLNIRYIILFRFHSLSAYFIDDSMSELYMNR